MAHELSLQGGLEAVAIRNQYAASRHAWNDCTSMSARPISAETALDSGHGTMLRSGIAPLDEHLGGISAGRIHLISGGVGAGKTTACLRFLHAGLRTGERAAMVTLDAPAELGAHAAFLGIDLASFVRREQLIALRLRPAFSRRIAASAGARVVDDLRAMLDSAAPPARVVIDPLSPFLLDGSPSGAGVAALVELLEGLGTTALLTVGHPLLPGGDRRLEPVSDRAATIVSVERNPDGAHQMVVLRARTVGAPATPLPFTIAAGPSRAARPGRHLVAAETHARSPSDRHRLALIAIGDAVAPEDALALLTGRHDVQIERSFRPERADAREVVSGVLITADRRGLTQATEMLRQLAASAARPGIVVMLSGRHRSVDRARLLRCGADEAIAWELGPPELLQRLERALARNHPRAMPAAHDARDPTPPVLHGSAGPKICAALAQALAERPPLESPVRWALLILEPRPRTGGGASKRSALAGILEGMARAAIRSADSDRAVAVDESVAVYLHDATAGDAEAVAARIRAAWRAGRHGPLRVRIACDRPAEAEADAAAAPEVRKSS